ncbi:MAG: aminoglycoside 6-adenylyltransferase [Anaerolineales bacterium]|jgi:aminoglycoside 6-adenylyltransferase
MKDTEKEDKIIQWLVEWGEQQGSIRAMLLTSSRANPSAPVDVFSDYDVILVVTDIHPFHEDDGWLQDFGKILVVYRDPIRLAYGFERFAYITQYEDGTKIDYTVWPVGIMPRIVDEPSLPDDLDVGYAVLLDKDHLTEQLRAPTYSAYVPSAPSKAEYLGAIKEFFHESTYVAKNLWRDELIFMKYNLDYVMKFRQLRKMLEWRMEIDQDWSVKTGAYGRGLKQRVEPEIWAELEGTYVGAGREENWGALFKTIDLFRRVAIEVGDHLGYAYPRDLDQRVVAYLQRVKDID